MIRTEIDSYKEQLDRNPQAYRSFPEEAKNEREITKYALDKDPFNMWYLPDRMKNNKDYAMETLSTYPTFHMNKLGEKLQGDKEMVLFAMKRNQTFGLRDLEQVCKHFIQDKEVMDKAMEKLRENPLLVAGEITMGRAMVINHLGIDKAIEAVKAEPEMYRLLSQEHKENPEVAFAAIKYAPYLVNEVPKELQNASFYTTAMMTIPETKAHLSKENLAAAEQVTEKAKLPFKNFDEMKKWVKGEAASAKTAGHDKEVEDFHFDRDDR